MKRSSEFGWALDYLQKEVEASDLLPDTYACYRLLLADGLRFVLERLSPARLRPLFAGQTHLSPSASTAERVVALLHHIPALHKLGQVLAHDHRLSISFRRRLQQLESFEPRIPTAEVVRLLEREFKGWRKAGIELGAAPLAEGSVAVVMPFEWKGPGILKLLKPGIQGLLEEDLEIFGSLGIFLDSDCERYHLPALDYQETFETIRDLLVHEVRLDEEQQHLAQAARIYKSVDSVRIPALFPFCTPRLTAMERIEGRKVTEGALPRTVSRRGFARTLVQALIAQPIFSSQPTALFHADPHAGNLLVTPDGRLGILDWSLVGHLRRCDRGEIVQLLLGALTLDSGRMERAIGALSRSPVPRPVLDDILRASLRQVRWGAFPGLGWLTELLDKLVLRGGARLERDLLLLRKTLLTLEGVLADLTLAEPTEQRNLLDEALVATFVQHCLADWPARLYSPWTARSPGTHVSTADLASLFLAGPTVVARWWGEAGLDALGAMRAGVKRGA